jgi:hypothetical protein
MYANGFLYEWNVPLRFKCIVTSLFEYSCLSVTCDRSVVFSTNKPDYHDITEILLKVALNTIKPNHTPQYTWLYFQQEDTLHLVKNGKKSQYTSTLYYLTNSSWH